jgi:hypothetical protein
MKKLNRLKNAITAIGGMQHTQAKIQAAKRKDPAWIAAHPVTSGLVPLVDYVPPAGGLVRQEIPWYAQLDSREVSY